jgi:2-polyprenyl-3-methyl-5-hydroxy-6-metoxy-1,4-benzoquinol methylase
MLESVNLDRAWTRPASEPTSPVALRERRDHIAAAAGAPVFDRIAYLCDCARGRDVLDVGCVDHTAHLGSQDWLHAHLRNVSRRCLGVDVVADEVNYLQQKGFEVICADITERPLEEQFDVIICGEVLEHLNGPVTMLRNLGSMLRVDGSIVVTVPNPFYANVLVQNLLGRQYFVWNIDHVAWFDPPCMAELAGRAGLRLRQFHGVNVSDAKTFLGRSFFRCRPLLIALGLRPELFARSIIYELTK